MKQSVVCIILSLILIIPTSKAFAETSVDIENNGNGALSNVHVQNNVGQNGNSSATVCINDQCTTSQDGNVDRQEGGASVKIENSTNTNTPEPSATPTPLRPDSAKAPTGKQGSEGQAPTITPTPTHEATHSAQITPQQTPGNKPQQSNIEQMIANIQNFINQLFSSHK